MRYVIILALAAATLVSTAGAEIGWDFLTVTGSPDYSSCDVVVTAPGIVSIYVLHRGTSGAGGARFSLPLPDCMNNQTILGTSSPYTFQGDYETGVTIDYGGCVTTDVVIFQIDLFVQTPADDCCLIVPLPHPAYGSRKAEIFDCAMNPLDAPAHPVIVNTTGGCPCTCCCTTIRPEVSAPFPPDGSDKILLNAVLTWDTCDPEQVPTEHTIFFGTDPDPPQVLDRFHDYSYDPGPLMPATTYYWTVGAWHRCGAALAKGPVWEFTTTPDVPVERSTWGAVKALYASGE